MIFWVIIALMSAVTVVVVLLPLVGSGRRTVGRDAFNAQVYKDQLAEVDRDEERGTLKADQAAAARAEIGRRLIAADGKAEKDGAEKKDGDMSPGFVIAIAILLPAGAVALYLVLGQPGTPGFPLAERGDLSTASRPPAGGDATPPNIGAMIEKLQTRLAARPDDLEGWVLLARSQMSRGNYAAGADAYKKALALKDDPALMTDYAESLVMTADTVTPDAMKIFTAVRARDPLNPKARFYIGMEKAAAGNVRGAVQEWVDLVVVSPPGSPWVPAVMERAAKGVRKLGLKLIDIRPSPEALALAKAAKAARAKAAALRLNRLGPGRADVEAAAKMKLAERDAFIRSMVKRLASRLRKNPNDPSGWEQLAQAYDVLGEPKKAAEARKKVKNLK
ncbi:MAG TPA: c-type cytochrome biogenesis protein CcmI [Alphaproteobacteria bacterium]|nr:c-type cytochrome biogenesis protein CcmI [Alphaproteobacteria bacterium]